MERTKRVRSTTAVTALAVVAMAAAATGLGIASAATVATVGQPVTAVSSAATATVTAQSMGRAQVSAFPPPPAVDNPALVGCDAGLLQALTAKQPSVAQWIMVVVPTTSDTAGVLSIATVHGNAWQCTLATTAARVGRQGIRPLLQRRSGDDTTPSGIFPLGVVATPQGPVSFFGNSADPGALGPYRRVQRGDCYGANPNTPGYGHWRVDTTGCTGDDELLQLNVQAYEHAVLIGANTEPNVSGDAAGETAYAAAIFLHRSSVNADGSTKATSGCVSIGHDALLTAVRTIDPASSPRFAIGTRADLVAS